MTPMKRPLQLHRKTRRQAACCGWNGAVGFNVAQPGVFSWRGGSTAPAEVKEMEARSNSTCDDFCVQRFWWVGTSIGLPTSIFNQRKDGQDGTSTSKTPEDEERSPNFHDRCCLLCFTDAFRTHLQYV